MPGTEYSCTDMYDLEDVHPVLILCCSCKGNNCIAMHLCAMDIIQESLQVIVAPGLSVCGAAAASARQRRLLGTHTVAALTWKPTAPLVPLAAGQEAAAGLGWALLLLLLPLGLLPLEHQYHCSRRGHC
jgi:hypothetical protein